MNPSNFRPDGNSLKGSSLYTWIKKHPEKVTIGVFDVSGELFVLVNPQSTKSRSFRLRMGWRSLRSALVSICRTRSRVTPKRLPTSSRVRS